MNPLKQVDILIKRYPELAYQRDNIIAAYNIMEKSYSNKGKLLIAGNGGSAADAEHIVGELMKGFENPRKLDTGYIKRMEAIDIEMGKVLGDNLQGGLPAIALDGHLSLSTALLENVIKHIFFSFIYFSSDASISNIFYCNLQTSL